MKIVCNTCKRNQEVPVTLDRIEDWESTGIPVRDFFPRLTEDQREILVSGICSTCWK